MIRIFSGQSGICEGGVRNKNQNPRWSQHAGIPLWLESDLVLITMFPSNGKPDTHASHRLTPSTYCNCHTVWKYKDRLVFILMSTRSLYLPPGCRVPS